MVLIVSSNYVYYDEKQNKMNIKDVIDFAFRRLFYSILELFLQCGIFCLSF